ncbi:autophagy- protein 2 [Actinomortierella ambigua]|nr:autophagy- protein 2 [Actinomortierella ambigua]
MKAWSFGSFFSSFAIPANLQKRLVSFLLQRAIGHFLEDSLDVEKLDIELSNGIVHLTDLKLNSKALNDLVAGTPLAVTNGSIRSITATIPLRNLWNGQCVLEIDGIDITLAPVQAQPDLAQDLEEQLLSSSVNLANEFLKQRGDGRQEEELGQSILQSLHHEAPHTPTGFPGDFNYRAPQSTASAEQSRSDGPGAWGSDSTEGSSDATTEGEGIQLVAKLIEKLLARIQVICRGTTLRLRHSSKLPLTGEQARRDSSLSTPSTSADKDELKLRDYELVVQLPFIAYRDETPGWAPTGNVDGSASGTGSISSSSSTLLEESTTIPSVIWQDAPESIKTVVFRGFSIWIRERDGSTNSASSPSPSLSSATATQPAEPSTPQPTQPRYPSSVEEGSIAAGNTNDYSPDSDSDSDVFMDAQDSFSRSVASSQYISRSTMLSASSRLDQSRFLQRTDSTASTRPTLYEAQIVSCLQHKNRVKVSIRKNASLSTGPVSQAVVRSLVDMDVYLKSLFVALSPNQVGFLLEILLAMEAAPSSSSEPQQASSGRTSGMSKPGVPQYRETSRGAGGPAAAHHGPSSSWGTQQQGRPNRADATPAPARNTYRSDDYFDRRSSMESQRSASPHAHSPMTGTRSPSLHHHAASGDRHDSGGRYYEQDRGSHHDPSSSSSHRILSESEYPGRSTLLPPPALSSTNVSSLSVKVKARLPTFQIYILLQDPASMHEVPTDATFFSNPRPETLRCNHIKVELDNLVLRYQQWRLPVSTTGGASPTSHSQPNPAHHRQHHPHQQPQQQQQQQAQQQQQQQQDTGRTKKFTKKSQIDFTLSKLLVAEWIDKQAPALAPVNNLGRPLREFQQRAYRTAPQKQYIPLVEFDPDLEPLTPEQGGGSKFCTLAMPSRYLSERASTLRSKNERRKQERARMEGGVGVGGSTGGAGSHRHPAASLADLRGISGSRPAMSSGESFRPGNSSGSTRADSPTSHSVTKEVIRMRVMLGGKKDPSSSSTTSASSSSSSSTSSDTGYAQDVTVEVKPFQVHVDLSTFQRMELLLQRFMVFSESRGRRQAALPSLSSQQQWSTKPSDPSMRWSSAQTSQEQQIMEDLDRHHQQQQQLQTAKPRTRFRLRLNTVRIWISVPDMAATLAGAKDTGSGGRSIYDMLALDISKLVLTQSSDMARAASILASGNGGSAAAGVQGASKFKVEFSNFSAFIIQEHAVQAKAILSITSLPTAASNMSGFTSTLPNLEITTKPVESIVTTAEAPPAAGAGGGRRATRMSGGGFTLPTAFNIFEGEENVHNVVNEEVELIDFQNRTMETSQLAINCQFPLVTAQLEKEVFDTLQLRANDLQTWIALFSEKLAADVQTLMPPLSPPLTTTTEEGVHTADFSSSSIYDHGDGTSGDLYGAYRADMARAPSDDGQLDKDDMSEHGTDRSTAYGEELRMLAADGHDPAARLRIPTARDYLARLQSVVRPTLASVVVSVQTVDALLHYPTSPTVLDPIPIVKSYQLTATEAGVFAAVKYQGSTDTYLYVEAKGLELSEVTAQKPKVALLVKTIPKNIKVKAPKPMFFMAAIMSMDVEANYKESNINLTFAGISWKFSIEQTAVDDVQDFFTEPKGIVYWNLPQQCTRVNVNLVECCMDYKPLHIPTRFVLSFDRMKVAATLRLESPTLTSKIQIHNMSLFLLDNVDYLLRPQHPSVNTSGPGIDSVIYWSSLGLAQIGQCPFFELVSVKSRNGQLPLYDLTITNQIFYLDTCSDSLQALMVFASYMGENGDLPVEKKQILERLAEAERAANRAKSNVIYQDVLASLDEDAFKHRPVVPAHAPVTTEKEKEKMKKKTTMTSTKSLSRDRYVPSELGASDIEDHLEVVEEFYAVDRDETYREVIRVQESPDLDGFHEVYADLVPSSSKSRTLSSASGKAAYPSSSSSLSSKSKARGRSSSSSPPSSPSSPPPKSSPPALAPTGSHFNNPPLIPSLSPTKDYFGRDMRRTPSSSSSKSRTGGGGSGGSRPLGQVEEGMVRLLDTEFKGFHVIENYYSVPVLTEEEQRQRKRGGGHDEGDTNAITKVRIRVRDFNFSWRLFDGLDFESSRMREEEAAADQRRRTWHGASPTAATGSSSSSHHHHRPYPEDPRLGDHHHHPHLSVGGGDNVFDRLSREYGRHHRYSPGSSEADSAMDDYQSDTMSQASSRRPATISSARRPAQLSPHGGGSRSTGRRSSIRSTTSTTGARSSLERSSRSMMEIRVEKVRLDFEDYVSGIERALSVSLRVKEVEILDNLQTSLWRKFLASQRPDSHKATPRLTQSSMIRLDLVGVRPVVAASTVEYRVKVRVLPLRLYIDQDALMFLIRFFVQSAGGDVASSSSSSSSAASAMASYDVAGESGGATGAGHGSDMAAAAAAAAAAATSGPERKKPSDLYFQSISVGTIALKMDYKPKHVDYTGLSGGNLVELMNFFHLEGAEMTLHEVRLRGISGIPKIGQELINLWLPHIRSTQVPHMVSGLTPIRSFVNVGSGIADLVLLPIEQYKKDGHLIKGLQKGGKAFTRATTLEALKIGTKLAVGTQVLLEHADDIFGSNRAAGASASAGGGGGGGGRPGNGPSEGYDPQNRRFVATMVSDHEAYMEESFEGEDQLFARWAGHDPQTIGGGMYDAESIISSGGSSSGGGGGPSGGGSGSHRVSKYANQPADVNEGMELAYKSLSKNFGAAAHTIFAVPMEVYERTGAQGSVRAVIRAVPVAVLKPMIGATEAFSKVLIGLRNSIDPAQRLQMEDKYKRP